MKKQLLTAAFAVGTVATASFLQAKPAEALTLGFNNVTNNNLSNVAIGKAQLFVDVNEVFGNTHQALFNFRNVGLNAASITDVYFDDGTLLGIASISNSTGVDFSQGATPPNLPGGEAINFHTTAGFLADSNPPVQQNGVNPGEQLGILFNLKPDKTFDDIINAINLSLANPGVDVENGLRIGIHVQGFADGGSESFVNSKPVPTPALLPGLVGMGFAALRKKKQEEKIAQNA